MHKISKIGLFLIALLTVGCSFPPTSSKPAPTNDPSKDYRLQNENLHFSGALKQDLGNVAVLKSCGNLTQQKHTYFFGVRFSNNKQELAFSIQIFQYKNPGSYDLNRSGSKKAQNSEAIAALTFPPTLPTPPSPGARPVLPDISANSWVSGSNPGSLTINSDGKSGHIEAVLKNSSPLSPATSNNKTASIQVSGDFSCS